jgi:hypothetical protein
VRDAEAVDAIDAVLFVGLADWYPPVYDCGACGSATCAEFMQATSRLRRHSQELEFVGPQCNLRDIDLGIAVGSAAKTAAIHSIDARCQTRSPGTHGASPPPPIRARCTTTTSYRPECGGLGSAVRRSPYSRTELDHLGGIQVRSTIPVERCARLLRYVARTG